MQGTLRLHGSEDKSRHEEVYTPAVHMSAGESRTDRQSVLSGSSWDRQAIHSSKCSLARCGEKVKAIMNVSEYRVGLSGGRPAPRVRMGSARRAEHVHYRLTTPYSLW